jgi:uncharacterized protein (TIGR00266 family)
MQIRTRSTSTGGMAPPRSTAQRSGRGQQRSRGRRKKTTAGGGGGGGQEPEYAVEITGRPAFSQICVTLRPGQSILANAGALAYMREGVLRGELSVGGVGAAFGRALGGQSFFRMRYTGAPAAADGSGSGDPDRRVTLAPAVPGDVLQLQLLPGQELLVSRESYIAGSPSIKVTGKLNWRGAFVVGQEEGLVLPRLVADEKAGGTVFLAAYGGFTRHDLGEGQTLLVDNGLFLASAALPNQEPYELVKLGRTLVSAVLGGEGLGMLFRGPATLFTQSHNLNDLVGYIADRLPSGRGASVAGNAAVELVGQMLQSGGGGGGGGSTGRERRGARTQSRGARTQCR